MHAPAGRKANGFSRRCLLRAGLAGLCGPLLGALGRLSAQESSGSSSNSSAAGDIGQIAQHGLQWLSAAQRGDGGFPAGKFTGDPGVVGMIGQSFLAEGSLPGRGAYGESLAQCVKFVLERMQADGYIRTAVEGASATMYSHGFAATFLAEAYHASMDERLRPPLERAIALSRRAQNDAGGWRYLPTPTGGDDSSVTACVLTSLATAKAAGIDVSADVLRAAADYLVSCQNEDGGFRYLPRPGSSGLPRSAAATAALVLTDMAMADTADADARITGVIEKAYGYLDAQRTSLTAAAAPAHFPFTAYFLVTAARGERSPAAQRVEKALRRACLASRDGDGLWNDQTVGPACATAVACRVLLQSL